jgi:cytidylate kinase
LQKIGSYPYGYGCALQGITFYAIQNCANTDKTIDIKKLISDLPKINLEFQNIDGELRLFLMGKT